MLQKTVRKLPVSKMRTAVILAVALVVVGSGLGIKRVVADQFDVQISALQGQNAAARGLLNGLASQASSYQAVINQLQAQIWAVQAQIAANQAQQAFLQQQIVEKQAEIDKYNKILSDLIKSIYFDGQITTIEMLATSRNLSDYVDKQEGQFILQHKIQELMAEMTKLKLQLQRQKDEIDQLVISQQAQNAQLSATQAQQQQMLAYNEGQQAAYNHQISTNQAQIGELRRQQAILNARYNIGNFKGDPNNGGYPNVWAHAPQDSMIDSWGMYNRECVSYTAFKVHQDFLGGRNDRDMPWWGGVGNANQWDDNARSAGIPVDSNPTAGSIAISNAGFYGHAMYVEAVNGNEIYIQQYNAQLNGQYSEGWRYTTGLVFIHF